MNRMQNLILYSKSKRRNMSTKKPCKNNPAYTFSGKESSPLGLGYTAESEQVGCTMEGRDKTMWMVGIKNGVKVWNRIPTHVAKASDQLVKDDGEASPSKQLNVDTDVPPPTPKKVAKKAPVTPVVADEVKRDLTEQIEAVADEPKPAPKKRAPAKKKAVETVVEQEVTEVPITKEEPKKKAPAKKKVAEAKPEVVAEVAEDVPAPPPKKKVVKKKAPVTTDA